MTKIDFMVDLLCTTQDTLYKTISNIECEGISREVGEGYIIFNRLGKPKPMLCVHLDTVDTRNNVVLIKDDIIVDNDVISLNPFSKHVRCLGGDDRCGVYIALDLLEKLFRGMLSHDSYSIAFFCDEEIGGKGSNLFMDAFDDHEALTTCFIGLDRRNGVKGIPEFATYGSDNEELFDIARIAYSEKRGSFTDASKLAYSKACINLSVGYNHEHTNKEVIYFNDTLYTLTYLLGVPFKNTEYLATETRPLYDYYGGYDKWDYKTPTNAVTCEWCGAHEPLYYEFDERGNEVMLCESCRRFV